MQHVGQVGQFFAHEFLSPPPGPPRHELGESLEVPVPYFLQAACVLPVPARGEPTRGDDLVRDPLECGEHHHQVPVACPCPGNDLHDVPDPLRSADGGAAEFHNVHGNLLNEKDRLQVAEVGLPE